MSWFGSLAAAISRAWNGDDEEEDIVEEPHSPPPRPNAPSPAPSPLSVEERLAAAASRATALEAEAAELEAALDIRSLPSFELSLTDLSRLHKRSARVTEELVQSLLSLDAIQLPPSSPPSSPPPAAASSPAAPPSAASGSVDSIRIARRTQVLDIQKLLARLDVVSREFQRLQAEATQSTPMLASDSLSRVGMSNLSISPSSTYAGLTTAALSKQPSNSSSSAPRAASPGVDGSSATATPGVAGNGTAERALDPPSATAASTPAR